MALQLIGATSAGADQPPSLDVEQHTKLALRERYALQGREQSSPPLLSEAEASLREATRRYVDEASATDPTGFNASTAEQHARRFCAARRGGCSWADALALLARAHEVLPKQSNGPAEWERATRAMSGSRPARTLEACERVSATSLDAATFFERHVVASRPVVITGLLDKWEAARRGSPRRWDLEYLWRRAANSTVKVYVSPDGEYEAVRRAGEVVGDERVCAACADADELVLMRPAETELRLEHFLWLVDGYANPERARFYLQKHPVRKWRLSPNAGERSLADDVKPAPHEQLAPYLRLAHELLWLSGPGTCTTGPLHYDENENLHAVVRGRKVFELFHPSEGAGALYDGQRMRSRHYLWRWLPEAMRGLLLALDPSQMQPSYQPFSPVRLRSPDVAKHPAFAHSRRLLCEVSEGDVLFIPSHWWHEVTAVPDESGGGGGGGGGGRGGGGGFGQKQGPTAEATASMPDELGGASSPPAPPPRGECGLTASLNYFFTPFYRKLSDLRTFAHEPLYDFMRSHPDLHVVTHPDRWRTAARHDEL